MGNDFSVQNVTIALSAFERLINEDYKKLSHLQYFYMDDHRGFWPAGSRNDDKAHGRHARPCPRGPEVLGGHVLPASAHPGGFRQSLLVPLVGPVARQGDAARSSWSAGPPPGGTTPAIMAARFRMSKHIIWRGDGKPARAVT